MEKGLEKMAKSQTCKMSQARAVVRAKKCREYLCICWMEIVVDVNSLDRRKKE